MILCRTVRFRCSIGIDEQPVLWKGRVGVGPSDVVIIITTITHFPTHLHDIAHPSTSGLVTGRKKDGDIMERQGLRFDISPRAEILDRGPPSLVTGD
ncbi:hypothetical protein TNCV_460451 [Trichonephila clavipes]|nr:hypothetical protein TNCV_460451 [Trichonephila clavipes]